MKLPSAITKCLTNKWVLNVVSLLALFNVIGYLVSGYLHAVLYFMVIAILVRYFSKNMIIVLGVPLLVVNLLVLQGRIQEGMENNSKNANANTNTHLNKEKKKAQHNINKLVRKNKDKPDPKSSQGLQMQPLDDAADPNATTATEDQGQQGFEPGRRKNKGYDIDYATTVEDAYDELNNILGSDGIQRLTADTQKLMTQQMQLAEAMKGMAPIMESMGPMINSLKGMMGNNNMNEMMDLAKKFTSK